MKLPRDLSGTEVARRLARHGTSAASAGSSREAVAPRRTERESGVPSQTGRDDRRQTSGTVKTSASILQGTLGASFTCSEHGDYQRIRTPYLYPDGDNIDLFCKIEGDTLTVSDLAETTGRLRTQSAVLRRSPKQTQLIEDACVPHGIEFYRGMLQARCRPGDELAQVVTRVAQAALRVSICGSASETQVED